MNIKLCMTWLLATTLTVGLATTGCSDSGSSNNNPQDTSNLPITEQIKGAITLSPFSDCEDLEGYLKDTAKEMITLGFDNGGFGWGNSPQPMNFDEEATGVTTGQASGTDNGGNSGGGSPAPPTEPTGEKGTSSGGGSYDIDDNYTGTNNQELGVDEADIVKTDGMYLYIVRSSTLLIVDAYPAEDAHVVSSTTIDGYPTQMFLQDDTVVVFSSVDPWDSALAESLGLTEEELDSMGWSPLTKVTVFDVSDREAPTPVRELIAEGSYINARLVGQTARIVVRSYPKLDSIGDVAYGMKGGSGVAVSSGQVATLDQETEPPREDQDGEASEPSFAIEEPVDEETDEDEEAQEEAPPLTTMPEPDPDDEDDTDDETKVMPIDVEEEEDIDEERLQAEYEAAMEELKAEMFDAIDATTLDQWLPRAWEITNPGSDNPQAEETQLVSCGDHFKQSIDGGLGFLSVLTLDLANATEPVPAISVIGEGHMVYAATDSLYVSNDVYTQWLTMMDDKQEDWQVSAIHRFHIGAEGKKAMYESTGVVPGSILNQFSMGEHDGHLRVATTRNMWDSGTIENAVTVLNADMDQVGQIEGIAPGERIYSARFIDDKGYVVTFEQIDPLFTLDLSDPTNPTIVGELKIPGFSTYIHPVGDGHLLTIGEETEDMGDWVQTIGMKLEIFDVSDLANPQSTHKFVFESGYYSEALYEHKAFNFHADLGLLAIPVNGYGWSGGGGGGDAPTVFVQDTAEEESPSSSGGGSSSDNGTDEDDGDEDSASGTSSAPVPVPIDEDEDEDEDGDEDSWEEEEGWTEEEEWIEEKEWEEPDHKVGLGVFTIDTTDGVDELGFIDHADFMNEENNWWYGEEVRRSLIMGDHVFSIGRLGLKIATADDLSITASVEFPEDNGPEMGKGVSGGTGGGFSTPPSTTTDPEPMPDDAPEETPEDTDEGDEGDEGSDA